MDEINEEDRVFYVRNQVIGILVSHSSMLSSYLTRYYATNDLSKERRQKVVLECKVLSGMIPACNFNQNLNQKANTVMTSMLYLYFTNCYCEIIFSYHYPIDKISFCIPLHIEHKSQIVH